MVYSTYIPRTVRQLQVLVRLDGRLARAWNGLCFYMFLLIEGFDVCGVWNDISFTEVGKPL